MTRRLVQILLPVRHQDGADVPAEEFARVRTELTERFGGVHRLFAQSCYRAVEDGRR
jgi:hypothetical protein